MFNFYLCTGCMKFKEIFRHGYCRECFEKAVVAQAKTMIVQGDKINTVAPAKRWRD